MTPLLLVLQANGEMYRQDATDLFVVKLIKIKLP